MIVGNIEVVNGHSDANPVLEAGPQRLHKLCHAHHMLFVNPAQPLPNSFPLQTPAQQLIDHTQTLSR